MATITNTVGKRKEAISKKTFKKPKTSKSKTSSDDNLPPIDPEVEEFLTEQVEEEEVDDAPATAVDDPTNENKEADDKDSADNEAADTSIVRPRAPTPVLATDIINSDIQHFQPKAPSSSRRRAPSERTTFAIGSQQGEEEITAAVVPPIQWQIHTN
uniref:Uncharacterized protein n=1 Tax=Oryza meridionalis TaxID=40149 RepID=A0A0E0CK10_9ORYZ